MARTPKSAFAHLVGKSFGVVLREYRNAARLSQQKLATEAEIDRKYLYQLEQGLSLPTLEMLFRLARALNVEISEIVDRTGSLITAASSREWPRAVPTAGRIPLGEDACPGCKAVYRLHARRLSVRERRKFKCAFCEREISAWSGTTAFLYGILRPPKNWGAS